MYGFVGGGLFFGVWDNFVDGNGVFFGGFFVDWEICWWFVFYWVCGFEGGEVDSFFM